MRSGGAATVQPGGDGKPPARKQRGSVINPAGHFESLSLCPETFYGWAMRMLIGGFVISGILTFTIAKPDMSEDPILMVYGVANACITFDYEPARSVMAVLWVFVCMCIAAYVILFNYRLKIYFPREHMVRRVSFPLGCLFFIMFSVMAISMVQRPEESIVGHTVPYQSLILATVIWWVYNTWVIECWPEKFAPKVLKYWRFVTVVYVIVSFVKIYLQWVLISIFHGDISEEDGEALVPSFKGVFDPIWMLLFVFYRFWNPLSGKNIVVTFTNDTRHNHPGEANICCFHIVSKKDQRDMHEDEFQDVGVNNPLVDAEGNASAEQP